MPEILDSLPEVKRTGRKPKYNYDELFSHGEKAVRLTQGEDFDCSLATMRHNIYREADRRGISVGTVTEGESAFAFKVLSAKRQKRAEKTAAKSKKK